jgi:hypothetical protein
MRRKIKKAESVHSWAVTETGSHLWNRANRVIDGSCVPGCSSTTCSCTVYCLKDSISLVFLSQCRRKPGNLKYATIACLQILTCLFIPFHSMLYENQIWNIFLKYPNSLIRITDMRQTYPLAHKKKVHGPSPRANYTDRATAACRRSDCQLLRIEGAT